MGCALGIAIGRALWALGPLYELYGGMVSRTLEVGGRSDSRIPFVIVQLVANGAGPFSKLAAAYLNPFDFSSRGPLAGLASTPIVLARGGRPPVDLPNQPWMPFDPQGFMAFRIAMMTFAATSLLSLWTWSGGSGACGPPASASCWERPRRFWCTRSGSPGRSCSPGRSSCSPSWP